MLKKAKWFGTRPALFQDGGPAFDLRTWLRLIMAQWSVPTPKTESSDFSGKLNYPEAVLLILFEWISTISASTNSDFDISGGETEQQLPPSYLPKHHQHAYFKVSTQNDLENIFKSSQKRSQQTMSWETTHL